MGFIFFDTNEASSLHGVKYIPASRIQMGFHCKMCMLFFQQGWKGSKEDAINTVTMIN